MIILLLKSLESEELKVLGMICITLKYIARNNYELW